jgi:hypothetical protein
MPQEQYKGHRITVHTHRQGNRWAAEFKIDDGEMRRIHGRREEKIAVGEALGEARWAIERMRLNS